MVVKNKNSIRKGGVEILKGIHEGRINPKEISIHERRLCVAYLRLEGYTQEDIADALGLTSIHVNRVLQSLRKGGLIEYKNRCLWVPDKDALAEKANISLQELEQLMLGI